MISFLAALLRFVIRGTLFVLFIILGLFPTLMLVNYHRHRDTAEGYRKSALVGTRLCQWLVWFFGITPKVSGEPAEGSVLVVANHVSWLDIPVLHSVRSMGFVAKAEIQRWPIFSYIARTGAVIFHQRGSHDSATGVAKLMASRLKSGRRVAIFPEGGIVPGTAIRVFHARLFRAAVEADCPVQPVMIRYMTNGQKNDEISFRENESMMVNLCRMLANPSSVAELYFLPLIESTDQPRRRLADAARAAVITSYES